MKPSKKVGITGGIGAGKSLCGNILREMGFEVLDADSISRALTARGTPGLERVIRTFGPEYLTEQGELDRRRLAGRVFSDASALQTLNDLLHPLIKEELRRQMSVREGIVFAEVPLLAESGLQDLFDKVWTVESDESLRIARAAARDKTDAETVRARLRRQATAEERMTLADVVLRNDGTPEQLRAQVEQALKTL